MLSLSLHVKSQTNFIQSPPEQKQLSLSALVFSNTLTAHTEQM